MADTVDLLEIEFLDCDAGWIKFKVSAGTQTVSLWATDLADPFPDMLAWLENLLEESLPCRFKVDEEGYSKVLAAQQSIDDAVDITIVGFPDDMFSSAMEGPDTHQYLVARAHPQQIARSFYKKFREFAEGALYRPKEWAGQSLGEALLEEIPDLPLKELHRLEASALNKLFWAIAPSYEIDFVDTPSVSEKLGKFARYALNRSDVDDPAEIKLTPQDEFVPSEFDRWDMRERSEYIAELLDEPARSCHGEDLKSLVSPKLEAAIK